MKVIKQSVRKSVCFICCILLLSSLDAQNNESDSLTIHLRKLDSLKMRLPAERTDTGQIKILLDVGLLSNSISDKSDSSGYYLNQALLLSQKIKNSGYEFMARNRLSMWYRSQSNLPAALEMSFKAIKIAYQLNDSDKIFNGTRQLLFIYEGMGDYQKMKEIADGIRTLVHTNYFERSGQQEFYKFTGYINWLGEAFGALGDYDSSVYFTRLSYQTANLLHNPQTIGIAATGLAFLYEILNQNDSALYFLRQSLPLLRQAGREDYWARAMIQVGGLLIKKGQLDSALIYLRTGLARSQTVRFANAIISGDSLFSEFYARTRHYDSAYFYLKDYFKIKDSVFNSDKATQMQKIILNQVFEQRRLEQEKKVAQQQYKSRIKIYGLIGGLVFLSVLALVLYRNIKQKQKANLRIDKAYKDLQSTQTQLIHAEKMASLGELTAGIAHEIQNPLNFVNNFSDVNTELIDELQNELKAGNVQSANEIAGNLKENEQKINHHGKRADAIVKGMLQHSRTSSGQKEATDINALADEYLRLAYHGLRAKDKTFNANFETDFDSGIGKINIVPQDMGRVLLNLINNAFYAVAEKKNLVADGYERIVIVTTKKTNGKVEIRVIDNGNGIPQKIIDKIFQPFFTTKPTGQGTGLGLSLAYDIVTKGHGGKLKVETKEGEGSAFIIELPIA